jgi:tetratricopeptide (TPR) repeat protein
MTPVDKQIERLLLEANLYRMRGNLVLAEETCRKALSLKPQDPSLLEFLGDLQAAQGDVDSARATYKTALSLKPGDPTLEEKIARLVISMPPKTYAGFREPSPAVVPRPETKNPSSGGANVGIALLLASLVPGLGQFYTRQVVKGLLVMALAAVAVVQVAVGLAPILSKLFNMYQGLVPSNPEALPSAPQLSDISPVGVLLWLLVLFVVWFYGCVDAGFAASRRSRAARRDSTLYPNAGNPP